MASPELQQPAGGLLGRDRECAVIHQLLEDACGGVSGALVVRGEPGIGKSALLEYAVRRSTPGMTILRTSGVEAEADLAFAGLHGLLRRPRGRPPWPAASPRQSRSHVPPPRYLWWPRGTG